MPISKPTGTFLIVQELQPQTAIYMQGLDWAIVYVLGNFWDKYKVKIQKSKNGCLNRLSKRAEINWHQTTYASFLHRYTIDHIHRTHRHLVVSYNNELALFAELTDHFGELAYVGII